MEHTIELLLKDHVINKKDLLMRKHDLIGMSREQAMLIMNVISLEETGSKINTNSIQKTFAYKKSELEQILADLMEQDLVKIKMTKQGLEFKFSDLWIKLLKTYITPGKDAKASDLESYVERMLDMKLTPSNRRDIETWVKQKGAKRLISIIEGIFKMNVKNVAFKMIKEIYVSEEATKKTRQKELEDIIKFDWLNK